MFFLSNKVLPLPQHIPSFLIKGSNTQEAAVCGFSFGGQLHHSLVPPSVVDVLKFHLIYLLASSYLCVCAVVHMCVCVRACVCQRKCSANILPH